jgi:guanyl-specific ribonuclease Sa
MSVERRKPFTFIHPNGQPTDPAHGMASLTISRPRRQMPAYHYQHQSQKRYATMLPGSSRSSATSSAESLYSTVSSAPRLRKLSAAEDVAARVRARWAALEALERANGAQPADNSVARIATGHNTSPGADASIFGRRWRRLPEREREREPEPGPGSEKEKEKENAVPMQVDGYEKPLPLPPRPPASALRITSPAPASMSTRTAAVTATTAPTLMVVDVCNDNEDGDKDKSRDDGPALPHSGSGPGAARAPASDSTLRTTPTSLTFVETESLRPILQRRPARALTPPQVRRRPSITDELEEAVRSYILPHKVTH